MPIDSPIEVESSCCESLVGLLTRASSSRSCLPRVSTPVAWFAPVLRAYSGVGRAGFTPASQINQTRKFIAQSNGESQAKVLPTAKRTMQKSGLKVASTHIPSHTWMKARKNSCRLWDSEAQWAGSPACRRCATPDFLDVPFERIYGGSPLVQTP